MHCFYSYTFFMPFYDVTLHNVVNYAFLQFNSWFKLFPRLTIDTVVFVLMFSSIEKCDFVKEVLLPPSKQKKDKDSC